MLYKIKILNEKIEKQQLQKSNYRFHKRIEWRMSVAKSARKQRTAKASTIWDASNVILTEIRCNQWLISVQVNSIVGFICTVYSIASRHARFCSFLFSFSKTEIDDMKQNYSVVYRGTEKKFEYLMAKRRRGRAWAEFR